MVARRTYAFCAPEHFAVDYSINPWMVVGQPVSAAVAVQQWRVILDTLAGLGHEVRTMAPAAGLPDMVFTANAGLVIDGTVIPARFQHPERRGEEQHFRRWFEEQGLTVVDAVGINEGEGDFLAVADVILAGHGFRGTPDTHAQFAEVFGREVLPMRLVDPRYYHLDTAVAVLDAESLGVVPHALDDESLAVLRRRFRVIEISADDAAVLGANVVSDGRHVLLEQAATRFADDLSAAGFEPIGIDMSELRKSGGAVKCCTLELHRTVVPSRRQPLDDARTTTPVT